MGFEAGLNRIKTDDRTLKSGKFDLLRLFGVRVNFLTEEDAVAGCNCLVERFVVSVEISTLRGGTSRERDGSRKDGRPRVRASSARADLAANETASADENTSDGAASASDRRGPPADAGQAGDQRGPPSDLPEQVPDFVSEIRTLIGRGRPANARVIGRTDRDLTPGDESDAAENATESPSGAVARTTLLRSRRGRGWRRGAVH